MEKHLRGNKGPDLAGVSAVLDGTCQNLKKRRSESGGAETALSPGGLVESFNFTEIDLLHPLENELADFVASFHLERLLPIEVYQDNLDLASVVRVDQSGSVDDTYPVFGSQAAAGLKETGKALRYGNGDAGRHQ
jgi:hypothetical protein